MTVAYKAMMFASHAHATQTRKYTGAPYVEHLGEVAGLVATASYAYDAPIADAMIAVAWMHDVLEDCDSVHADDLADQFPALVVMGVGWLSDLETGSRAERKAASRARLAGAPGWVQTIKCADIISNTRSLAQYDPVFAATYFHEKRLLLRVLTRANERLRALAMSQVMSP